MSGPWTNRKKHKGHEQLVDQMLGTSRADTTFHNSYHIPTTKRINDKPASCTRRSTSISVFVDTHTDKLPHGVLPTLQKTPRHSFKIFRNCRLQSTQILAIYGFLPVLTSLSYIIIIREVDLIQCSKTTHKHKDFRFY